MYVVTYLQDGGGSHHIMLLSEDIEGQLTTPTGSSDDLFLGNETSVRQKLVKTSFKTCRHVVNNLGKQ